MFPYPNPFYFPNDFRPSSDAYHFRVDVCNLRWGSIDLKAGFINVLTAKAGKPVSIPILAPLKKFLDPLYTVTCKDRDFVFPDAAAMYAANPSGITRRGKLLFANALFKNKPAEAVEVVNETRMTPAQIIATIRASRFSENPNNCFHAANYTTTGINHNESCNFARISLACIKFNQNIG